MDPDKQIYGQRIRKGEACSLYVSFSIKIIIMLHSTDLRVILDRRRGGRGEGQSLHSIKLSLPPCFKSSADGCIGSETAILHLIQFLVRWSSPAACEPGTCPAQGFDLRATRSRSCLTSQARGPNSLVRKMVSTVFNRGLQ